jgi:hypothetical protein
MGLKEKSQQFAFIAAVCMQNRSFRSATPGAADSRLSAAGGGGTGSE